MLVCLPFYYKNTGKQRINDKRFLEVLQESDTIHQALQTLGLATGQGHYKRAIKLLQKI